jgi:hypothetical protein
MELKDAMGMLANLIEFSEFAPNYATTCKKAIASMSAEDKALLLACINAEVADLLHE